MYIPLKSENKLNWAMFLTVFVSTQLNLAFETTEQESK